MDNWGAWGNWEDVVLGTGGAGEHSVENWGAQGELGGYSMDNWGARVDWEGAVLVTGGTGEHSGNWECTA